MARQEKSTKPTLATLHLIMEKASKFKTEKPKPKTRRYKGGKLVLNDEQKRIMAILNDAKEQGKTIKETTTYFTIQAPPSLKPIRTYCDITGLPTNYKFPGNQIRYYDTECFGIVKNMPAGVDQQYLSLRGANVVLK